jgi:hypothetical protein
MPALRSLSLVCENIHNDGNGYRSFIRLHAACAALQSLRELSIKSNAGGLEGPVAAVFPGSLTGLTSLYLHRDEAGDVVEEEDALVAAAFSRLVNLQQLDSKYVQRRSSRRWASSHASPGSVQQLHI